MAATDERQRLAAVLLDAVEEMDFPTEAQLDRVERVISSRQELEDYIDILMQKLEGKMFPHRQLLERLERLLGALQRLDQETRRDR